MKKYQVQRDDLMEFLLEADELDRSKGIIIVGKPGLGKSTGMKKYLELFPKFPEYEDEEPKWFGTHYLKINTLCSSYRATQYNSINDLRGKKSLFIDDVGRESPISVYGTIYQPFKELIEIFYDDYQESRIKPLIFITANKSLEEIGEIYGDHVEDRIYELCNIVEVIGESYRKL